MILQYPNSRYKNFNGAARNFFELGQKKIKKIGSLENLLHSFKQITSACRITHQLVMAEQQQRSQHRKRSKHTNREGWKLSGARGGQLVSVPPVFSSNRRYANAKIEKENSDPQFVLLTYSLQIYCRPNSY